MGVYCWQCGIRDKTVSYHRFPKDGAVRAKWLAFCGIEEKYLKATSFLCSHHFTKDDLIKKTNSVILKCGAIPSIINVKKGNKRLNLTNDDEYQLSIKKHNLDKILTDTICADPQIDTPTQDAETASTSIKVEPRTPPKTIPEPRYIGDICSPHLRTPRRAKRALSLTKQVITQQKRTIKTLQQSQNRLRTRIRTLKDLLIELKQRNLVFESAFEKLMAGSPDIMQEILERKNGLRKMYPAQLRRFALTLFFQGLRLRQKNI